SPAQIVRLTDAEALDDGSYRTAALAFVASPDAEFRVAATRAARAAGVPVNVVDHPDLCDFTTPAVIDRGEVVAAIGTGGASPMLATLLRQDIEARVPKGAGRVAALFRAAQERIRQALPDLDRRRAFMRAALTGPAAEAAMAGDLDRAHVLLDQALADDLASGRPAGRVSFLAAGGPAELLSLRAVRALAQAEVLVIAKGCEREIVDLARRDARRLEGAANLALLRDLAEQGLSVVRLAPEPPSQADLQTLADAGVATELLPVARSDPY
ncbi:MAG TPA: NAD(P)-dependent oxidoreductase, partial [Caulobacteraceae bacterium]